MGMFNKYGVSFWGDDILELESDDDCTTFSNVLNDTNSGCFRMVKIVNFMLP